MAPKPTYEELENRIRMLEKERADLLSAEARLRESESSFVQLFERAPVPMAYASESDGYNGTTWNAQWYKTFRYSRSYAEGRSGYEIGLWVNPEDRFRLIETANRQNYVTNFETRLRRHDGTVRICSLFVRFIEKTGNRLLMVIYFDITERKEAEKEMTRLRSSLSDIIDSMPSVLIGTDGNGTVTQWNKTAEQRSGVTAPNAYGKKISDVFPSMTTHLSLITESIRSRQVRQRSKIPRKVAGSTYYEDITIYPLTGNGNEGAVIRIDDVSEKVHMEKIMLQSEKMLSLGGLAAGMAHEINNPLAGMIQTAHVLSNRLGGRVDISANVRAAEEAGTSLEAIKMFMISREVLPMIQRIRESGKRVADIVENMLNFVRKNDGAMSSHDPVKLLEKTLELASTDYDLKKHYDFRTIEIVKSYEDNLPMVPCHGARIQQVLLNVLRNGAQAMQDHMETNEGYRPRFDIRLFREKGKDQLCFEIKDNGPGMNEDICRRIFEPFFTTKPVGLGTGLGLSISYFIITEHHEGEMRVESAPGAGTKFIILLPYNRARTQNRSTTKI